MNAVHKAPNGFQPKKRGHTAAYAELREMAEEAKKMSGTWVMCDGMTFTNPNTAKATAYRIRSGKRAAFNEVGTFEATWLTNEDGTFTVLVRHIA